MLKTRLIGIVSISLPFVAGCGSDKPPDQDEGVAAMVNGNAVDDDTEFSDVHSDVRVAIPQDRPEDVPLFPGARPTMCFGTKMKTIRMETRRSAAEVHTFYETELARTGWALDHNAPLNIQASKPGGRSVTVDLIEGDPLTVAVRFKPLSKQE